MTPFTSPSDLPPPLRGTDPDSFAQYTVETRWPRIARQTIRENEFSKTVEERIEGLADEIRDGAIRPIDDPGAPDEALWNEFIAPHRSKTWYEVPWFFGETYFYRRLLEATGYFRADASRDRDPFSAQKTRSLVQAADAVKALTKGRASTRSSGKEARTTVAGLLRTALWGNQADLSMWGADEAGPDHLGTDREEEHLLVDDTEAALDHLASLDRPARVDLWADNAGVELMADLAFVDGLLESGLAQFVVVHAKAHPTFVSDVTIDDVHRTLDWLEEADEAVSRSFAERLRTAMAQGQLRLRDSLIWTSPLLARAFPLHVQSEIARADLVVSKGDANYRRLVGDRHWPFTTPFETVVSFFPAPLLALRTLKAEVAVGLSETQVDRLDAEDPEWLTNGEWGVIQFAEDTSPLGNERT